MLNKALVLGLFSATAMGLMTLPAQADTATVQTITDDIYIEGYDNTWRGSTEQESYTGRVNGRSAVSTAQDAYTRATVVGEGNRVYQKNKQTSRTVEMNRRRPVRQPLAR